VTTTLPKILRDAMLLLGDGRERVVIARGHAHEPLDGRCEAFQIRLQRADDATGYAMVCMCEARSWLGEEWSRWRGHCGWLGGAGFDMADVLATDWRILS